MDNFRPTGSLLPGQFYIDPNTDAGKKILELQAELERLRQGGREHIFGDSEKGKHEIVLLREQLKEANAENIKLRRGMTGDYDLDAWLYFYTQKDQLLAAQAAIRELIDDYINETGYTYSSKGSKNRPAIDRALKESK